MAEDDDAVVISPLGQGLGNSFLFRAVSNLRLVAAVESSNEPGVVGYPGARLPRRAEFDVEFVTVDNASEFSANVPSPRGVLVDMLRSTAYGQYSQMASFVGVRCEILIRAHPPESIVWLLDNLTVEDPNRDSNHFSAKVILVEQIGYRNLTSDGFVRLEEGELIAPPPPGLINLADLGSFAAETPVILLYRDGNQLVQSDEASAGYRASIAEWANRNARSPAAKFQTASHDEYLLKNAILPPTRNVATVLQPLGAYDPFATIAITLRDGGTERIGITGGYEGSNLSRSMSDKKAYVSGLVSIDPPDPVQDSAGNIVPAWGQAFTFFGIPLHLATSLRGDFLQMIIYGPTTTFIDGKLEITVDKQDMLFPHTHKPHVLKTFLSKSGTNFVETDLFVSVINFANPTAIEPIVKEDFLSDRARYRILIGNGAHL